MTLAEWLESEEERLAAFARFWRESAAKNKEHFPPDMAAGEWDEQYRAFDGA